MQEILSLSGLAQGRLIADGAITSEDLIRAHLERIEAVNPALNAAIEVLAETALAAARQSDERRVQGRRRGPLDGVPFSIKDSIEVRGTVASAGTLGFRNAPASAADATLVARLRAAGAIPMARTNLPDLLFAFESDNLIYGRTNNPYDHSRTSGGSSGGEAALIAACGSPFGLGSDAAGSVRLPAHFCGIASLKPTSGRLPRTGHVPPAVGLGGSRVADRTDGAPRGGPVRHDAAAARPRWPRPHRGTDALLRPGAGGHGRSAHRLVRGQRDHGAGCRNSSRGTPGRGRIACPRCPPARNRARLRTGNALPRSRWR